MGFISKIFGDKKEERQQEINNVSQNDAPQTVQPEENSNITVEEQPQQSEKPAEKQEPQSQTSASANRVDVSKFRFNDGSEQPQPQPQSQNIDINLNCNIGEPVVSNELRTELINESFQGPQGIQKYGERTIEENVFVSGYMQNVMIKMAEENNKPQDKAVFLNILTMHSRMMAGKLRSVEKLYFYVSKTTNMPYVVDASTVLIYSLEGAEQFEKVMKENHFDVARHEVEGKDVVAFSKALMRDGYRNVLLADGVHPGFSIPVQIFDLENEAKNVTPSTMENPKLKMAITQFFQEIRRGVDYEGAAALRKEMEETMLRELSRATYILPCQKDENGRDINPVLKDDKGTETLPVFTDVQEMQKVFGGVMPMQASYGKIVEMLSRMGIKVFAINIAGTRVVIDEQIREAIEKFK